MLTALTNTTPAEMMQQVIAWAKAFGCDGRVVDKLEECESIVEGHEVDLDEQFSEGAETMRSEIVNGLDVLKELSSVSLEDVEKFIKATEAPKRDDT